MVTAWLVGCCMHAQGPMIMSCLAYSRANAWLLVWGMCVRSGVFLQGRRLTGWWWLGGYWCTGVVLVCILGLCTRGCALGLCTRGVYNGGGLCTGDVHIGAVCQGCALGGYWCVYWGLCTGLCARVVYWYVY